MKKFKKINRFLPGLCFFILIILILQFVVNSKYTFPEPHAFRGEYIYNPYRNIDRTKWRMANFHAHTRKFLENRKRIDRSTQVLDSLYRYLGYSIISISDYQFINPYENKNKWFVPVYEHGYQYYKNHQLVLNAKKVSWQDFPFRQTLSNKQFIIDQLKKETTALVTLVHPILRKAYSYNDFKYLSNYDCLEIANHERLFTSYYDTILSEGHPVFIMADDDGHDMTNIKEVCSSFNLINTDLVKDSVLNSLKTGRSIGVKFNIIPIKTNEEKRAALLKLPEINSITFRNDTLSVSLDQVVKTIKFIGQQGTERKSITNCSTGSYFFNTNDTYIRTEIECDDGTLYFLNPFFRYDGIRLTYYAASQDTLKTWALRAAVIIVLIITIVIRNYKKVNV